MHIALVYKAAAQRDILTFKATVNLQQTGGEDCGLFSIAYTLGEDISSLYTKYNFGIIMEQQ